MSNLVLISGDFCSGSTLLFTVFRKAGEYYCLYEPLHEDLLEYLIWPLGVYEHHYFVENYHSEYRGFRRIPKLFQRRWGVSNLSLAPIDEEDDLYRYISYLIGTAFSRSAKVLLKENRLTFRLGWFRARFPHARIIHIYRDRKKQWDSMVRRVQAHFGKEDVGQDATDFPGFGMSGWCEDLKGRFPQLEASRSRTGYDRFCKLWELSYAENQRHADLSVNYGDLCSDFETTIARIGTCAGCRFDVELLKQLVIPPDQQRHLRSGPPELQKRAWNLIDRLGRRYARARLAVRELIHEKTSMGK